MTVVRGTRVDGRSYTIDLTGAKRLPLPPDHPTSLVVVEDGPDGRPVVVKRPKPTAGAEVVDRVAREMEFVRRLATDGARRLPFVGGGPEPMPHVLTTYVVGRTSLSEHVRRCGPAAVAAPAWLDGLLVAVTGQLVEIERLGIIHRDVKPANLLVGGDGRGGVAPGDVALIDLGHACAPRDHGLTTLTLPGMRVGTPGWMGPAQRAAATAEPWWDVLNLGLVAAWAAFGAAESSPLPESPTEEAVRELATRCARSSLPSRTARMIEVALIDRLSPGEFLRQLEATGLTTEPPTAVTAPAGSSGARLPGLGGATMTAGRERPGPDPVPGREPALADTEAGADVPGSPAPDPRLPSNAAWAAAECSYRELRVEQRRRVTLREAATPVPPPRRPRSPTPVLLLTVLVVALSLGLVALLAITNA